MGGGDGKSGSSWRGEAREQASARRVWRRQQSQRHDERNKHGGEWQAEGVVLRKASAGGTTQEEKATKEAHDNGASAYERTYYDEAKTENESA